MGGQFGHRGPSGRLRQHLHGGVDVGNARLVLPRTAQRVSAVYHCLAALYAAYGAAVEHIAEVEPGPGGRRRNAVAATVLKHQVGVIVVVRPSAAYKVDGAVYLAVFEISPLAGHLSVLVAEHAHIAHCRLVATVDSHGHPLELRSPIVVIIAHGEVLQIEASAVAKVEHRVADAVAQAVFPENSPQSICTTFCNRKEIILSHERQNAGIGSKQKFILRIQHPRQAAESADFFLRAVLSEKCQCPGHRFTAVIQR